MTSSSTFPARLSKIDELTLSDHSYLTAEDVCYFLGEYTARKGFAGSAMNNLVLNLKKPVSKRCKPEWPYKEKAIVEIAVALRRALNTEWLNKSCLVPIPPSKAKHDPLYDDRLVQVLRAMRPEPPLDIREMIVQTESTESIHTQAQRPRPQPEDLEKIYRFDESLRMPIPQIIGLFDDVLTTGSHFKATQSILRKAFPDVRIIGLFIARRAPEAVDIEEFL